MSQRVWRMQARQGDLDAACASYTEALGLDAPYGRHLLLANRSGARLQLGDSQGALQDANAATECGPPSFHTAVIRQVLSFRPGIWHLPLWLNAHDLPDLVCDASLAHIEVQGQHAGNVCCNVVHRWRHTRPCRIMQQQQRPYTEAGAEMQTSPRRRTTRVCASSLKGWSLRLLGCGNKAVLTPPTNQTELGVGLVI